MPSLVKEKKSLIFKDYLKNSSDDNLLYCNKTISY